MGAIREEIPEPNRLLRIRVSLNGRPLKSYVFDKDVILVGRDPECDVVLENTGVSRHHVKFELSPTGFYVVTDLESANGTLFNDRPLKKDFIYSGGGGDVLQIGKFTLWVTREADRRFMSAERKPTPEADARTVVLSAEEMQRLDREARAHRLAAVAPMTLPIQATPGPAAAAQPATHPRARGHSTAQMPWMALTVSFLLGVLAGVVGARFLGP